VPARNPGSPDRIVLTVLIQAAMPGQFSFP